VSQKVAKTKKKAPKTFVFGADLVETTELENPGKGVFACCPVL